MIQPLLKAAVVHDRIVTRKLQIAEPESAIRAEVSLVARAILIRVPVSMPAHESPLNLRVVVTGCVQVVDLVIEGREVVISGRPDDVGGWVFCSAKVGGESRVFAFGVAEDRDALTAEQRSGRWSWTAALTLVAGAGSGPQTVGSSPEPLDPMWELRPDRPDRDRAVSPFDEIRTSATFRSGW